MSPAFLLLLGLLIVNLRVTVAREAVQSAASDAARPPLHRPHPDEPSRHAAPPTARQQSHRQASQLDCLTTTVTTRPAGSRPRLVLNPDPGHRDSRDLSSSNLGYSVVCLPACHDHARNDGQPSRHLQGRWKPHADPPLHP